MPDATIGGIKVHYEDVGGGPHVVCLVHGSGGTGMVWSRQLEGLADVARAIAPDLPGHGQSGGDGIGSIDEAARVVHALLGTLGIAKAIVGGHSMGGAVAQAFALRYHERLAGLVLVGTGARLKVLPEIFERLERDYPAGARYLTKLALAESAPPQLVETLARETARTAPRSLIGDFRACDVFDVMARLGEIHAPTLVVCGAEDRLTPPKYARFFEEKIAGARLTVVDGAGHYVQVEKPDETTGAIRHFLASLPAPA